MASAVYSGEADGGRIIRRAMKSPMLTLEREQELTLRWCKSRDEKALSELIESHVRLVVALSRRFRNYGLPHSDIIQEGTLGLMQAASRFDPERGVRFSTYAGWWIRAAIQDYVLRNWSIVRTGTTASHKALFFSLRRLRARFGDLDEHLNAKARTAIAAETAISEADIETMAARLAASDRSLNAPIGEDGSDWQNLLVDDSEGPDAIVMRQHDDAVRHRLIDWAFGRLNAREAEIVRARQLSDDPQTLEALGRKIGVSKERIRQIEQVAMQKLRRAIEGRVGDPFAAGLLG